MKTSSVITCVTTTSEDSTAPVAMVTCCTLTTAPAEVRLDFLFVCDGDEGDVSEEVKNSRYETTDMKTIISCVASFLIFYVKICKSDVI